MAARRLSSQMNKWNTFKVAMYGACLGLLYAASLEIGLWTHPDVYGQAGGGLIGGTFSGAILGLFIWGFRNSFFRFLADAISGLLSSFAWCPEATRTGSFPFAFSPGAPARRDEASPPPIISPECSTERQDRKSTRLNSSHQKISYA